MIDPNAWNMICELLALLDQIEASASDEKRVLSLVGLRFVIAENNGYRISFEESVATATMQ